MLRKAVSYTFYDCTAGMIKNSGMRAANRLKARSAKPKVRARCEQQEAVYKLRETVWKGLRYSGDAVTMPCQFGDGGDERRESETNVQRLG